MIAMHSVDGHSQYGVKRVKKKRNIVEEVVIAGIVIFLMASLGHFVLKPRIYDEYVLWFMNQFLIKYHVIFSFIFVPIAFLSAFLITFAPAVLIYWLYSRNILGSVVVGFLSYIGQFIWVILTFELF